MTKKSFLKRAPLSGEMSLQITSMADIFMILLVFLLKSYASGAVDLTPSNGLLVPMADESSGAVNALKLEVSEKAITIEGQPIARIERFKFDAEDVASNGSSKTLNAALEKERSRQLLIAKNNPDVKVDARVIVLADQRAPYSTIKTVLASAALNGYTDFKLAVVNPN